MLKDNRKAIIHMPTLGNKQLKENTKQTQEQDSTLNIKG